MIIMK